MKTIPTEGGGHNTYVTPDGKFVVAGSIAGKTLTVNRHQDRGDGLDAADFDGGVRPMTFDTNPDGSTKRIFVQMSEFNGFAVVDFATQKEIKRDHAA